MDIKTFIKHFILFPLGKKIVTQDVEYLATIFMLHRMQFKDVKYGAHSKNILREALMYLSENGYNFISINELLERAQKKLPPVKKAVAFTMDDGYFDQAEIAIPIFIEFNCPVTVFLITDFIDKKTLPWDAIIKQCFYETNLKKLYIKYKDSSFSYNLNDENSRIYAMRIFREYCKKLDSSELNNILKILSKLTNVKINKDNAYYQPMTWEQARMYESKNINYGSHTASHPILSSISDTLAENEIKKAWNRLNQELSNPVKIFAYPIGYFRDFLQRDIEILKENGFIGALTAEPGYFDQVEMQQNENARYFIKRFSFPENIDDLIQYCSGIEDIKNRIRIYFTIPTLKNRRYLISLLLNYFLEKIGYYNIYKTVKWEKINRLIYICTGNICRSPYAEYKSHEFNLNTLSAGINADGNSMANQDAIKHAYYRNVNMSNHISRSISDIKFTNHDLILCMEPNHAKEIENYEYVRNNNPQITLLGLWCTKKKLVINDPFEKNEIVYQKCFTSIDDALKNIATILAKHNSVLFNNKIKGI